MRQSTLSSRLPVSLQTISARSWRALLQPCRIGPAPRISAGHRTSRTCCLLALTTRSWLLSLPPAGRKPNPAVPSSTASSWIRAVAELRGDVAAPMSPLLLNGAAPDMSWQKGLNDVSKRHHIRMWREAGTWRGQRDVDRSRYSGYRLRVLAAGAEGSRTESRRTLTRSATKSLMIWHSRPVETSWTGRIGQTFHDSPAMPQAIP